VRFTLVAVEQSCVGCVALLTGRDCWSCPSPGRLFQVVDELSQAAVRYRSTLVVFQLFSRNATPKLSEAERIVIESSWYGVGSV
jgi:hypothetical protein